MIYNLLEPYLPDLLIAAIGGALAFVFTLVADILFIKGHFKGLPVDQGKTVTREDGTEVSINAESKNKVTSTGTIFIVYFLLFSLLFTKPTPEYAVYCAVMLFTMIIGYLDDAVFGAKKTTDRVKQAKIDKRTEYINGILELVSALVPAIAFTIWNDTTIHIFNFSVYVPKTLYVLLASLLIWVSVNAVNGTDGVDGLCGSIYIMNISTYILIFYITLGNYNLRGMILEFALLAYLIHNFGDSRILMGDAGSRPIGVFLGIMAMMSGHPVSFLLISSVFIFDGFLGVCKLAFLRTYERVFGHAKKETLRTKGIFKIAFPFHVHLKSNCGWEKPRVVRFFLLLQFILSLVCIALFSLICKGSVINN